MAQTELVFLLEVINPSCTMNPRIRIGSWKTLITISFGLGQRPLWLRFILPKHSRILGRQRRGRRSKNLLRWCGWHCCKHHWWWVSPLEAQLPIDWNRRRFPHTKVSIRWCVEVDLKTINRSPIQILWSSWNGRRGESSNDGMVANWLSGNYNRSFLRLLANLGIS